MHIQSDKNGTCTMVVLQHFNDTCTHETFLNGLKSAVKNFDDGKTTGVDGRALNLYGDHKLERLAIIQATTNAGQSNANENLKKFGFKLLMSHPSRKYGWTINIWAMPVPEFLENLYGDK